MASRRKRKSAKAVPTRRFKSQVLKHVILLVVLTFVVFGNTMRNGYTYDDKAFIGQNYLVQKGFKGIPTLLKTDFWAGYTNVHQVNPSYRPFPLITLAIEYQFSGLNPMVNHFFNLLFYALTCIVLYFLLQALFRDRYPYLSVITAILFCVHPIHTDVLANVKGRDDILALLGGLSALLFLIRYVDRGRIKWLAGALICYFLGLLSKEHIIIWVAVVPLTLYFFRGLRWKRIVTVSSWFWVISAVYFAIRTSIIGSKFVQGVDFIDNPILHASTVSEMWATRISLLGFTIQKLLIPFPLSSDYSFKSFDLSTWSSPSVYISIVIYGALVYLAIKGMRSKNVHAYAIALFTITLAPVSNIFFDYVVAFAERALYTPSFGFIFLFSIACYRGYVYILNRGWVSGKTLRAVSVSLFGLLTLVYAGIAFQRNPVWKDDLTLFSTDAKTLPDNVRLNLNYAQEVINRNTQTTPVPMNDALKDAKKSIDRAMQMVPDMSKAYLLYGNLAKITGDYQNAENNYRQAMETDPNNPAVYFNLGLMAQLSENLPQAKRYYLTSISLFPGYTSALQNLGIVYGRQNNLDSCIIVLEKAFSLDRDPAICFNLENAYSLKGDQAKAAYYRSMLSPKQK